MSYTASYIVNSSSAQGTTDFQFTFPYIKEEHIEVYLNYSKITQGSGSAQYQVITNVSPKLIRLNTGIASANLRVEVRRNSSLGSPLVDYADGSTLTANDLDTSALQSLYIDQELKDNQGKTVSVDETTGLPELNNLRLTNVANPTAAQDAATKNYVDTNDALKVNKAGDTMSGALAMGTNKVTGVGDPTAAQDAVTKAYLERTGSITSTQILDGTIVDADINANAAITGNKLQLASGSNPGALSTSDFSKLANIETAATADQTDAEIRAAVEAASDSNVFTDADHSKLNAIEPNATADQTDAEIRAAVEAASDSNVFTDADHTKLNAIEANATADQTASEIKSLIATSPLDASHLAENSVGDSEIATGALDNRYYTETELLTGGVLDARYYTESEADARFYNLSSGEEIQSGETWSAADNKIATTAAIDARIIDLVDDVGGFVPIANETSFPAANPDVNNGAGTLVSVKSFASSHTPSGGSVTIANGAGSGNTVTITGCGSTVLAAGFGGIVETTSTLHTYTFHRLTPKATEVTTVAGNITNINTVAGNNSNINTVAGNNSNINTVAGISGNVTTVAGISSNVTSVANNSSNINSVNSNSSNINTVAGAISNVNTVGGAIANVNTVATNISGVNDFADRYRVASSDPTSNNDEGDLCFNTTSNELRVYNGSAWQGGVTATGNLAGLGANTFTGAQTFISSQTFDGRDLSVDGAKLDGIEAGATANQTAAEIRTLVENAGDSNVFTDADHTKLNGIETAATADQTAAEIRTLVESASDSNVFTDADHSKLNGIEASATADQTKSDIDALNINADQVDGLHATSFLRSDADDTMSANLTVDNGTSTLLNVKCDNGGNAIVRAGGDGQGTGVLEVVQDDANHGGGISYNGDGSPSFVSGETADHVTFYRINAGTRTEVFCYSYSSNTVKFEATPTVGGVSLVKTNDTIAQATNADTLDGVQGALFARKDGHNMAGTTFRVDGADFIVKDDTDSTTNYIWRDHSDNKLYLGTPNAVITTRSHVLAGADSTYDIGTNTTRFANVYADTLHGDGSNLTNLPSTGGATPVVITANRTAVASDYVFVNASGLTVTLPSSPSAGDSVKVRIIGTNYATIARNSSNIESAAENFYHDLADKCATFTYANSSLGWQVGC